MKKLTLIACTMPALMLLNGCDAVSTDIVTRLCVDESSNSIYTSCTTASSCSRGTTYDTYSTFGACLEAGDAAEARHSSSWNLCTKKTDAYNETICVPNASCDYDYNYNSNWISKAACSEASDIWLINNHT